MSYIFDGVNDALHSLTAPVTTGPLTIACWVKEPTLQSAADALVHIGTQGSANTFYKLGVNASNQIVAQQDVASTTRTATHTAATLQTATWHHAAATFTSDSSRKAYLDGSGTTNATASSATTGLDCIYLGNTPLLGADFTGLLAHVAVWDVALSDGDISSLAAGANPLTIDPTNLIAYWPLTADDDDDVGTNHLTVTNEAALQSPADDPTVNPASTILAFQYQSRLNPLLRM
jgi:hypothetical protein